MSDEIIKPPNTSDNSLTPALSYISNKTRVKFDWSCLKQDEITFTHGKIVVIYIVYEINWWNYVDSTDPSIRNSLFGAVSLVKIIKDINKYYKYSGNGIGFDIEGTFSIFTGEFAKNVIILGVDMSYFVHVDNKKKGILILGKGPTQRLNDTTLTAEKNFSINFTEHNKKFSLSLHYSEANSHLFINGVEIYKFKAKDSEILATPLCLGNISKDFPADNMKNTGFYRYVYDFNVDYDAIPVDDILDIHKYLMKKNSMI